MAGISASNFTSAVKYYDEKKFTLSDSLKKDSTPIYKFSLSLTDPSLNGKIADAWVFSFDGKGGDYLERVKLRELNEYTTLVEENSYWEEKAEGLLNSEWVKLTIEVLSDGKNNRLLRAINVSY